MEILCQAGVVLRPFPGVGVRITIGTPEENDRLARVLGNAPPQGEFDPLRGAVWLGEEDRFSVLGDRARPALDKAGVVLDPVERLRRLLRTQVRELAPVRRGVCFPFAGK